MNDVTTERAAELARGHHHHVHVGADRTFAVLMAVQWVVGIVFALILSPYAWKGRTATPHVHLYAAVFLGGALASLPIALAWRRPGATLTRHVVAVAQMLWSALFIHLSGGRIETHFHVFGSLAFLAFYRDWRVLLTATVVVASDHFLRGLLWPESVYGIPEVQLWRFLEHAGWVVFEDVVLIAGCVRQVREMQTIAERQAVVEDLSAREQEKSRALDAALATLRSSQETLVRTEKLAAVGQLAAGVGHELRNPLAAIRNAQTYLAKRLGDPAKAAEAAADPRIRQFLDLMDRELSASNRIITDLLDFARERPPQKLACPLRPLIDEALGIVPGREGVKVTNEVSAEAPIPMLDKDQFRQVIVNLVQNAVEAIPTDRTGTVVVRLDGGGAAPWRLSVADDGPGIPPDVVTQVFQPLFTTKSKGTGLGLAIVASIVQRHGGSVRIETAVGRGTTFHVEVPADKPQLVGAA